jgi:hypothetical protein
VVIAAILLAEADIELARKINDSMQYAPSNILRARQKLVTTNRQPLGRDLRGAPFLHQNNVDVKDHVEATAESGGYFTADDGARGRSGRDCLGMYTELKSSLPKNPEARDSQDPSSGSQGALRNPCSDENLSNCLVS